MRVCILNHKNRDVSDLRDQIESWDYECSVFTDHTDFYKTRDKKRYWGVVNNVMHIWGSYTQEEWKIVIHDDMEVTQDSLIAVEKVLNSAPTTLISFYNPTNKLYKDAYDKGHHVMQTYSSVWLPFYAVHNSLQRAVYRYLTNNWEKVYEKGYAEDGLLLRTISDMNVPIYATLPSFGQHDGYDRSLHGNPAKCGKNLRNSFSYNPVYDYHEIDWEYHFKNAYINKSKISWNE